jgi:hypothetical protein
MKIRRTITIKTETPAMRMTGLFSKVSEATVGTINGDLVMILLTFCCWKKSAGNWGSKVLLLSESLSDSLTSQSVCMKTGKEVKSFVSSTKVSQYTLTANGRVELRTAVLSPSQMAR